MKKKTVSITDIARVCGVSAMTVSRALRQSARVHPETRELILAKAGELGYFKSSRLGRPVSASEEKPRRVQIVLGEGGSTVSIFHSRLVNLIQRRLIRHNCECVIFSNDSEFSNFVTLLNALKRMESDVTIFIGDFPEDQLKTFLMTFPGAVLLDNPGVENFDATFSSFNFDNQLGAERMMDHLISCGRKRIVLLSGRKDHFFSRALERAYSRKLADNKIAFDSRLLLRGDFTALGAAEEMERFLEQNIPFDAVFSNDEMALGVCRVLQQHGFKIPADAAVAGCDNLPLGQMLYPALSTVNLDYEKLADAAIDFITGGNGIPCRLLIQPDLLIRESSVLL